MIDIGFLKELWSLKDDVVVLKECGYLSERLSLFWMFEDETRQGLIMIYGS